MGFQIQKEVRAPITIFTSYHRCLAGSEIRLWLMPAEGLKFHKILTTWGIFLIQKCSVAWDWEPSITPSIPDHVCLYPQSLKISAKWAQKE